MKKLFKGLMALVMMVSLVGCGNNEPKDALARIKEQGYITFGTSPDYAPNEFYMQDPATGERKIVGSDIALAKAVAEKIGVDLVIQESDFNTVILNAQKVSVSRATLYRYLDVLVSTGDVKKYILSESDKACYQYVDSSEDCKEHFHLMCIDCGTLQHLECLQINEIINHVVQDHKFKVDPGRVVLYGLCEECQKNHQEE